MRKILAGGVVAIAAMAAAYFGLFVDRESDGGPERLVVVEQQVLAPEASSGTVASVASKPQAVSAPEAAPAPQTEVPVVAPAPQTEVPVVAPAPQTEVPVVAPAPQTEVPAVAPAPRGEVPVVAAAPRGETLTEDIARAAPSAEETNKAVAAGQAAGEPAEDGEAKPDNTEDAARPLPRFDVVRVDRDGQTVIAGTAAPNERVEILLDGKVVAVSEADAKGAFVTVVTADISGDAVQLQLRTRLPAGDGVLEASPPAAVVVKDPETATAPEPSAAKGAQTAVAQPTTQPNGAPSDNAVPGVSEAPLTTLTAKAVPELPSGRLMPTPRTPDAEVRVPGIGSGGAVVSADVVKPAVRAVPVDRARTTEAPEPAYALSAPVIILPSASGDAAPALVQPREEQVALLQPLGNATSVTLDAIRYGETGAVRLNGRGIPGNSVRIYGNDESLGATGIMQNGTWAWALERKRALGIKLFRFDELDPNGSVASRIETPFTYEVRSPKVLREREVVIQRGDVLWRIAEKYYGEGLRYSLIYGANTDLIRDPDLIYPGQVFSIPELVDAE